MKEYLDVSKTILFTDELADRIQREADRLNVSFAAVVRDCVEHDLHKFRERHKKRKIRGKKAGTNSGTVRDKP